MVGASGADVLAAIIAGYEVTCRVALALPAGEHITTAAIHPTATCGAFGAAAAAARVFGLDADGVAVALGTVLSQAAGSLQFLANGAWTKRFQVGWAAINGLMAATLVREGFKGASEALEGKHGFMRAYAPNPTPERAVQDLGQVWELMNTAVKPYPSCRYGHAGIDAALALRAANDIKPSEITADPPWAAEGGHAADRRAGGEEGQPGKRRRRAVQRAVRDLRGVGDRRDGLGQLRPAEGSHRAQPAAEGGMRVRPGDRGRIPHQHVRQADHRGPRPAIRAEGRGAERRADQLPVGT